MKILISLTYYLPYTSGLTLYVRNLSEALIKKDYTATILTTQHEKYLSQEEKTGGVFVKRVPYLFKISKGFFMPSYLKTVISFIRKNDLVIVNLPQPEGLLTALVAKIFKKPLYVIYHAEVILPGGIINLLVEKILLIVSLIILALSDIIIVNNSDFVSASKILHFFKKKLFFMYPPVNFLPSTKKSKIWLNRKIQRKPVFYIGFMGRIASEKGIEYLIDSIPYLKKGLQKEFVIIIAGPEVAVGEEKYRKKIINLIKKNNEYVKNIGYLSEEEKKLFYSSLDVFVFPSINSTESFGMVQVEAMMSGIPVVAFDIPGIRVPILMTKMGKLVQFKKGGNLAKTIIKVINEKNNYSSSIKKYAREKFSYEQYISEFDTLISLTKK